MTGREYGLEVAVATYTKTHESRGGRAGPWEEEQGRGGGGGTAGQEGPSGRSSGSEVETTMKRSEFPAFLRIEVRAAGQGRNAQGWGLPATGSLLA